MNPGVSRNASTHTIVCRSRMSDVTVSLAKKRPKNVRKRTRRGGWEAARTSGRHRGHEAAGSLFDVLFGDKRGEDCIE